MTASISALANNSTTTFRACSVALGIDSNTTPGSFVGYALVSSLGGFSIRAQHAAVFSAGIHYLAWLEYGAGADTQSWYGQADKGMEGLIFA